MLLQNNGLPLDKERVERLDRAAGHAGVRVRFGPEPIRSSCPRARARTPRWAG